MYLSEHAVKGLFVALTGYAMLHLTCYPFGMNTLEMLVLKRHSELL